MININKKFQEDQNCILFHGDCSTLIQEIPDKFVDLTITSPPYFMGKEYDTSLKVDDFILAHKKLLPEIIRITKDGGSICWQVGYHVKNSSVTPLDFLIHDIMKRHSNVYLRNRIIWTFGHGLHARNRFSGRHEVILWYTKGNDYYFNLDSVRVQQKYPGKRHYKGVNKGKISGNPLGKNPSDIWDIPNVKANHPEKTIHPCQFPIALVQRLIRALSIVDGYVFDPYMGVGSSAVATIIDKRRYIGAEINSEYYNIAFDRCSKAINNELKYRHAEKPIYVPNPNQSVARKPVSFKWD